MKMMKFLFQVALCVGAVQLKAKGDGLDELKVCVSRGKPPVLDVYRPSVSGIPDYEAAPPTNEHAFSYTFKVYFRGKQYAPSEQATVGDTYYTHTRLAVCGAEAGYPFGIEKRTDGMIAVARSNSVKAKVCPTCFVQLVL